MHCLWPRRGFNRNETHPFDLMVVGGVPEQGEFDYPVPRFNTELEVLFWLAEQNEFTSNDTLALAIAIDHGFLTTMATDEVRQHIYGDVGDLLTFARKIAEQQRAMGLSYDLEDFPLEAQIAWAWRGSENVGYSFIYLRDSGSRIDEDIYSQRVVSLPTLEEMGTFVVEHWFKQDPDRIIEEMENLYIDLPDHWAGHTPTWTEGGEGDRSLLDANLAWANFKRTGKGIGVCVDEATFVSALLKSIGISSIPIEVGGARKDNSKLEAHAFVMWYDPGTNAWKSYSDQAAVVSTAYKPPYWIDVYLPPIQQAGLLRSRDPSGEFPMFAVAEYRPTIVNIGDIDFLVGGLPTDIFKEKVVWPFYFDKEYVVPYSELAQ